MNHWGIGPICFCVGVARNSANGCPTRGVPIKGRSVKRSMMGGGVSEWQARLPEGPRAVESSGSGAAVVVGAFSTCHMAVTNALLIY